MSLAQSTAMHVAILAGGASRRMGRDKTTLDWHGRPLLGRAVEIARMAGAEAIAIAGGPVTVIGCTPLDDAVRDRGPLGGIIAALRWQPRVLVLACDMPLMSPEFLAWLWQRACNFSGWTVPGSQRSSQPASQPLCSVYTAALLPWLERAAAQPPAPGARSLAAILSAAPRQLVATDEISACGFDPRMFANLNTPAEYAAALTGAGPSATSPRAPLMLTPARGPQCPKPALRPTGTVPSACPAETLAPPHAPLMLAPGCVEEGVDA